MGGGCGVGGGVGGGGGGDRHSEVTDGGAAWTLNLSEALTVLGVEQHLVELGLVVIKRPPDFVYHLLIGQVTVHEAAQTGGRVDRRTES